jgi:hypothetical protein
VIRANTRAEDAEDRLRRLAVKPSDAAFWETRIEPAAEPAGRRPLAT